MAAAAVFVDVLVSSTGNVLLATWLSDNGHADDDDGAGNVGATAFGAFALKIRIPL